MFQLFSTLFKYTVGVSPTTDFLSIPFLMDGCDDVHEMDYVRTICRYVKYI